MMILSLVGVLFLSTKCFLCDILDRAGADAAQVALFGKETDSDSSSLSGTHRRPRGPYGPQHFASIVQEDWLAGHLLTRFST